jgi:hypothetical protein
MKTYIIDANYSRMRGGWIERYVVVAEDMNEAIGLVTELCPGASSVEYVQVIIEKTPIIVHDTSD